MDTPRATEPEEKEEREIQKPEFLEWVIDLFKIILGYNWKEYGTKKDF